ncbi:MAG: hypothetical protein AB1779_09305 [Candidatus Thermoplasmatota archaeon]
MPLEKRQYKIPKHEELLGAIKKVISEKKVIYSQRRFKEFVQKELRNSNPAYSISEVRVRVVALSSGIANVEIHVKEKETKKQLIKCPVCLSALKPIKNETVYGGIVTVGHSCTMCPYWTGTKRRVPTKYVFLKK